MEHNYSLQDHGIVIRPVRLEDARFILTLRTDPSLNKFIGDTTSDVSLQENWIRSYFQRQGDYYFVIETRDCRPIGTVGLYDVTGESGQGEWGRWIVRPPFPAAAGSADLIYRFAFETLKLESAYCRTVSENQHVVAFHDSSGARRKEIQRAAVRIRGVDQDFTVHEVTRAEWPAISERLSKIAKRTERFFT